MVISSLIIETNALQTKSVARHLIAAAPTPAVEVHGIHDQHVIVTIEADTVEDSHKIASSFIHIDGVTGVNLIYANFEDDPDIQKVMEK